MATAKIIYSDRVTGCKSTGAAERVVMPEFRRAFPDASIDKKVVKESDVERDGTAHQISIVASQ